MATPSRLLRESFGQASSALSAITATLQNGTLTLMLAPIRIYGSLSTFRVSARNWPLVPSSVVNRSDVLAGDEERQRLALTGRYYYWLRGPVPAAILNECA
jgi:hypothetical protein